MLLACLRNVVGVDVDAAISSAEVGPKTADAAADVQHAFLLGNTDVLTDQRPIPANGLRTQPLADPEQQRMLQRPVQPALDIHLPLQYDKRSVKR